MAVVTYPAFAPDDAVGTSFGSASTNVALPGTLGGDSLVRVVNLGPNTVSVKLGTSSAVVATNQDTAILPGHELFLTLASNTYIAGIQHGGTGMGSTCNIATGN